MNWRCEESGMNIYTENLKVQPDLLHQEDVLYMLKPAIMIPTGQKSKQAPLIFP